MTMAKPRLIVFDLDYTLWPFWVDTRVSAPFHTESSGQIKDAHGYNVKPFPDVPGMLHRLQSEGYIMAAASRTDCPHVAHPLLKVLDWDKYFTYKEIYPGQKTTHFRKFLNQSKIPYDQMLFFDDEFRNVRDVSALGVTCIYAENGMSNRLLQEGFAQFAQKNK